MARRLYQAAPNHQLGTLVRYKQLPSDGTFHRALADAEMTGHLWLAMLADLQQEFGLNAPTFELLQKSPRKPKQMCRSFYANTQTSELKKQKADKSKDYRRCFNKQIKCSTTCQQKQQAPSNNGPSITA